jgi:hypothetical protein
MCNAFVPEFYKANSIAEKMILSTKSKLVVEFIGKPKAG